MYGANYFGAVYFGEVYTATGNTITTGTVFDPNFKTATDSYGNVWTAVGGLFHTTVDDVLPAFPVDGGMFLAAFLGETTFNFKQFPVSYAASPIVAIAGLLSSQPLDQGITWKKIPNAMNFMGPDLPKDHMNTICELGLNPIGRTTMGRRGNFFEVVACTDNTGAQNGSDFWSLMQVRLIMHVIENLRTIGRRYLGSIGYGQAKLDMQQFMLGMVSQGILRSFKLNISKQSSVENGVVDIMSVDVSLQPYFSIRQISFIARVGPGA